VLKKTTRANTLFSIGHTLYPIAFKNFFVFPCVLQIEEKYQNILKKLTCEDPSFAAGSSHKSAVKRGEGITTAGTIPKPALIPPSTAGSNPQRHVHSGQQGCPFTVSFS
jgi:hypothetical protein